MSRTRQNIVIGSAAAPALAMEIGRYLTHHPSVRDCLRDGLINLSALSRLIHASEGLQHVTTEQAILKSLQRISIRLNSNNPQNQSQVMKLVKKARVRVRTEMGVVLARSPDNVDIIHNLQKRIIADRGDFQAIDGDGFIVIITHEDHLPDVRRALRNYVKTVTERLAELHLIFGEKIEVTAGVVSYVYQRLAERGINIREEMSCWTDIKLLIDERDLPRALEALDFTE